jgi:tRNA-dihydrouridine synthase
MLTVHGRTRKQGYTGTADWSFVREAVRIVAEMGADCVVVGNGDVDTGEDARRLVEETGCGGVMIGRGAVRNPFLFWEARAALGIVSDCVQPIERGWEGDVMFWRALFDYGFGGTGVIEGPKAERVVQGRLKMILKYYGATDNSFSEARKVHLMRLRVDSSEQLLDAILEAIWQERYSNAAITI